MIEKVVHCFSSFAEAEEAEHRAYAALSPQERLDLLLEMLSETWTDDDEATAGLQRVYRVIELGKR